MSREQAQGLTREIQEAADELWRRADRIGHAAREVDASMLSDVLARESAQLQKLSMAISSAHKALIQQPFAGYSSLKDKERFFRAWTEAENSLTRWDE